MAAVADLQSRSPAFPCPRVLFCVRSARAIAATTSLKTTQPITHRVVDATPPSRYERKEKWNRLWAWLLADDEANGTAVDQQVSATEREQRPRTAEEPL